MIEDIRIKDFALIDEAFLEFGDGFTVLSGETGAGKSILIGAISFLLGGKGGPELIRTGAQEAQVSGTLKPNLSITGFAAWLDEHGIQPEDGRLLLRRSVRVNGKTSAWIQNVSVTRQELAQMTAWCIDIHGQHEHQSLLRIAEHRRFLDSYAGIENEVAQFTALYARLVEKRQELESADMDERQRAEKIEFLTFAAGEIEAARLKDNEDNELAQEENRLAQYEKLYQEIEAFSALTGAQGESVFYELSDIAEEVRSYAQSLVFDPARLEEVQERQALFFKLKKKYASSVQAPLSEVVLYAQEAKAQLERLSLGETQRVQLKKQVEELERSVYGAAVELSAKRRASAENMEKAVETVLADLGMKGTKFCVHIEQKQAAADDQKCGPYGIDDIEFLISPNPGNPAKPLAKIASGGELSRVMLALKTVLGNSDFIDTLIFDEIDTGIGGEVAVAVGAHLKHLAAGRQILCITHLANIAVYADTQIKIEKSVAEGATSTHVYPISGEKRVEEIARMLSGDRLSSVSLEHARTMLNTYGG